MAFKIEVVLEEVHRKDFNEGACWEGEEEAFRTEGVLEAAEVPISGAEVHRNGAWAGEGRALQGKRMMMMMMKRGVEVVMV